MMTKQNLTTARNLIASDQSMSDHPFTLRRTLFYIAIAGTCLLTLIYLSYQARYLLNGPQLALSIEPSIVHNERVIELTGHAANITHVTLNGRPMYTDRDGYFAQALVLENGYTIATIEAHDRYGRVATIEQPFVYRPASFIE